MDPIPLFEKCIRSCLALIGFPLSLYQLSISKYERFKFKPTGSTVGFGSITRHAYVIGQGSPTIILESGMGGNSLDWSLVQDELAKHATVLSYDRAGFGWSTMPLKQPTCSHYVAELRLLLNQLNLKPPYILVGHSYGGMMMRLFASEYPDEVQGLVLVDSTHESRYLRRNGIDRRTKERKRHLKLLRLGYILSPIAIPRMMRKHVGSNRLPEGVQRIASALGYTNGAYKAAYLELLCSELSAAQLKQSKPLRRDLPVKVLTAGKQSEEWKKDQLKLLQLTEQTEQFIVGDSWHSIQIHRPDVVIAAV